MLINKEHLSLYEIKEHVKLTALIERVVNKEMPDKNSESKVSVFLSHKHDDDKVLRQIITLLKKLKVSVYLDWLDEEMPSVTCGETAEAIKQKIEENDKFILLATESAVNSKWCNWELGYGDSKKFPKNIAVLPILGADKANWKGNEYLDIYPIIKSDYQYVKGNYYVEFKNKKTPLAQWLKE